MNPEQEIQRLKSTCQFILEQAQKFGADAAFVSASYGIQSRVSYEKGDYNLATRHEGSGFSITIHKNMASGSASVNSFDKSHITKSIEQALHLAKHSVPDEYLVLAPAASYIDLKIPFDQTLCEMDMGELLNYSKFFIDLCTLSPKISIDSATTELGAGVRVIANTNGMVATDQSASLQWSAMGMAIDGDDITSFDFEGDQSCMLSNCKSKMTQSAQLFRDKLLCCLGAQKGKSFNGPMLLNPSLVEEFFLDSIIFHIQGSNIMDGKSRWSEALGQAIVNPKIHLDDEPHNTRMRGCTTFSGEGVPTKPMNIIEDGKLNTHLYSLYSANRCGTLPTGNGGGPHVPIMKGGPKSLQEIIRSTQGPMIRPSRFSGNIDAVSGDFSGVAKGSQLYLDGKHVGPLREVMISGNVFDLLKANMELSQEREDDGGYYLLPHILVDGISVTAD